MAERCLAPRIWRCPNVTMPPTYLRCSEHQDISLAAERAVHDELESWVDGLRASDFESTHGLSEEDAKAAIKLLNLMLGGF